MTELQDYLGVMYVLSYLAVEVAHKEVTSNARIILGRKTQDVKMAQALALSNYLLYLLW
jgi:hypothetical protein